MTRIRILPYKAGSRSAKALSAALNAKRLRLTGSTYKAKVGDVLINWGNSRPTSEVNPTLALEGLKYLNPPMMVRVAANKLNFFKWCEGQSWLPEFWTNKDEIPDDSFPVVCRTILNGHSGSGIVIADRRDDLVDAPLYVTYKKKKTEYRVHVCTRYGDRSTGDTTPIRDVLFVQRKARKLSIPLEDVDFRIRNLDGGFSFVLAEEDEVPECVIEAAKECLSLLGLDFGALDIAYNEAQDKAWVLECNTAPGLEERTLQKYADYFKEFI